MMNWLFILILVVLVRLWLVNLLKGDHGTVVYVLVKWNVIVWSGTAQVCCCWNDWWSPPIRLKSMSVMAVVWLATLVGANTARAPRIWKPWTFPMLQNCYSKNWWPWMLVLVWFSVILFNIPLLSLLHIILLVIHSLYIIHIHAFLSLQTHLDLLLFLLYSVYTKIKRLNKLPLICSMDVLMMIFGLRMKGPVNRTENFFARAHVLVRDEVGGV